MTILAIIVSSSRILCGVHYISDVISAIIIAFIIVIFLAAFLQGQDMAALISDSLVRFGQNLILALAMMPAIMSGIGLNMGLAIGIVCGLLGGMISIELGLTNIYGIACAMLIALIVGSLVGVIYGKILNGIKGSEMLIGNYLGYTVVYLMCMFWFAAPFSNPTIIWPMGGDGTNCPGPTAWCCWRRWPTFPSTCSLRSRCATAAP